MSVNYVIMISWIKINDKLHRERPLRDLMKCSLPMEGMTTSIFCISLMLRNIIGGFRYDSWKWIYWLNLIRSFSTINFSLTPQVLLLIENYKEKENGSSNYTCKNFLNISYTSNVTSEKTSKGWHLATQKQHLLTKIWTYSYIELNWV